MAEIALRSIDFSALLDELESGSSGSCASVIRKLREYEVAAYEAGQGGPTGELIANFIARLDERVADRELEIEKMCSYNYESFVESVQELMVMQEKAEELQQSLRQIRANVEDCVQKLTVSSEAFTTTHATINRIDQCISALRTSIPVLDRYEKIEKSIAEGRYYHALKSLEHLEHYQIKSIQSYSFAQALVKRIPELRAEIKAASLAQLTDFLEEIRKHSIRLGAIAMHQTAEKMGMREEFFEGSKTATGKPRGDVNMNKNSESDCDDTDSGTSMHTHTRSTVPRNNVFQSNRIDVLEAELEELAQTSKKAAYVDGEDNRVGSEAYWHSSKNNIENLINFWPIYRCLHIHSVSGERSEFEHYYFTQRRKQCQLILSLSPSQQSSLRNYSEFFSRVVGFFLVDDYLRHTLPGAAAGAGAGAAAAASYYQSYLTDMWGTLVPRLVQIISRNAKSCTTTGELLSLKHHCVLFERTMANLGFHTAGLNEMSEAARRQFSHLLINQWKTRFEDIFKNDNYTAIRLDTPSDLTPELAAYPYCQSTEFTAQPYPRSLVFSPMVPSIYTAVREYIDTSAEFIAAPSGDLAWTELEDSLNRATNVLFTDCLAAHLNDIIQSSETDLLRLIQLTINLTELEDACEHLQMYLHEHARPKFFPGSAVTTVDEDQDDEQGVDLLALMASRPDEMQPSRSHLYGVSLFRDSRARAETQIYTLLNLRIEEFCGLASYDGVFGGSGEGALSFDQLSDVEYQKDSLRVSEYMTDMMAWLASTFAAFTHLPPKVAHTACISACKYIVKILQRILMGPAVKMVMEPALTQMLVDLGECDKFARSNPVPGIDKSILLLIFSELRQLLELVRNDDWNVFFSNYGKTTGNPYDRVTPAAAISLLERIREATKRRQNTHSFFLVGSSKRPERENRRRLDDVLRQLKDLQVPSASKRF